MATPVSKLKKQELLDELHGLSGVVDVELSGDENVAELRKTLTEARKLAEEDDSDDSDDSDESDEADDGGGDEEDEGAPESTPEPQPSHIANSSRIVPQDKAERGRVEGLKEQPKDDYLKQYECNKETGLPWHEASRLGVSYVPPAPGSKAEKMKKNLLGQTTVRVIVPRQQNEAPGIPLSVNLDGYRLDFPKQRYIDVPQQIAEVIMDSLSQTEAAFENMQRRHGIDGSARRQEALS